MTQKSKFKVELFTLGIRWESDKRNWDWRVIEIKEMKN